MSQPTAIRVLIIDDHAIVRQGLVAMIDNQPDMTLVGQAGNGQEAIDQYRQLQPDVTLMDLRMPQVSGVDATMAICAEFAHAHIIILTTYDGDEDIYRGLRAGAKGYLLKDAEPEELLSAIHVVHRGQQYIPAHVGAKLAQRINHRELSDRELEVLQLVAQGMSNLQISAALNIAESTVKSNINHILSKLGAKDRTQATIIALKRGIASL
ncbi:MULTISPECIES: response regulator transcription factor [Trichocoleus]|uniref:Response regulator transcription factor n=1 Tax=Trichocoleus desertorum GB2-A4 TaxID=2933944 RepID=A0ABV0JEY3_9CYAN|nr:MULTISPECIES: response regulator transcription factor [unclassified Trichocoleus]MBD1864500.1 response regulator transcription factor [Trichocoleus sp. FACHB-46]MBD2097226.1 response regulator transcription factor [Trichocoleus sp. FACHB-591]MBD2120409.1 response regulator transcription factor [Trichocoleus sp. FACHB-262]